MCKPKALMLIPQLGYGGAEGSFLRVATFLSEYVRVNIGLFSVNYGKSGYTLAETNHGFLVLTLSNTENDGTGFLLKLRRWFQMFLRLRELKKQNDVVISFLSGANLLNALTGSKAKTIVSVRGSRTFNDSDGQVKHFLWRRVLDRIIYSRANRIVCASRGLEHEVKINFTQFAARTVAIEGTVRSTELFNAANRPVEAEVKSLRNFPTIVTYGRLHRTKGFDFLIRVFAEVRKSVSNAKLLIMGDGPEAESLHTLAYQLDLRVGSEVRPDDYDLFFVGYKKTPQRYLRYGTVFAFPSRSEGLANTLIEALSTGIPIMAADCSWGVRSILGFHSDAVNEQSMSQFFLPRYGTLMPAPESAGAEDAWAQALHQILIHPPGRLSEDQCREAIKPFDIETTGPQWLNLIQEVIESQSGVS